jgi:hypothetical protein
MLGISWMVMLKAGQEEITKDREAIYGAQNGPEKRPKSGNF